MDRAKTSTLTGAEIVVRCLQEEGVEFVFGYPGGAVLFIYDELFKQDKVKHVLVRHEQGAVHAADGYSRSSRKVGVALVTSGPGVTNAVTGIATAYMDSIPMVVITGQVPTAAIGLDAFQECDTVGITRPIVKHNMLVKDVKDLASAIKKAFHIATTGRPGPVVVDIPKDVTQHACEFVYPESVHMRSYNPVRKGHAGQIKKAVQLLLEAERPLVYTGGGVVLSDAASQLRELVKALGFPCTNTLMGLGAYPATDKQFLGMLGMHGTYEANMAMQHCDVLLAIGARFDDRVIGNPKHFFAEDRTIIHVDIDPSSISKRVRVDIPIVGNVRDVLREFIRQAEAAKQRMDEEARAASAVNAALRHAGIHARPVRVRVQREPFGNKDTRAERFAPGTRFNKERLWHLDRAVGALVILHDRDQRPPHGKPGAVERVDEMRALLSRLAEARVHAPRLEVAAIRARGNFSIGVLSRQPDLDVVGLTRVEAHVAGA